MGLNVLMVKRALQANDAWATHNMLRSRARRWGLIAGADIVGIAVVLATLRIVGAVVSGTDEPAATLASDRLKTDSVAKLPLPPNKAVAIAFADAKPIADKPLMAAPPKASRDLLFAAADVTGAAFPASPPAANRFSPTMSAERMNAAFAPSDVVEADGYAFHRTLIIWQPAGNPSVIASLDPESDKANPPDKQRAAKATPPEPKPHVAASRSSADHRRSHGCRRDPAVSIVATTVALADRPPAPSREP